MAKIIFPCFSDEAHGKISYSLVFSTNAHGTYARLEFPKKDPATPAQIKVRRAYGNMGIEWGKLTEEDREEYRRRGRALKTNGYDLFFKEKWPDVYKP